MTRSSAGVGVRHRPVGGLAVGLVAAGSVAVGSVAVGLVAGPASAPAGAASATTRPVAPGLVGQPCDRPGALSGSGGQRVVCVRVGTRLVWQLAERMPGGGTFPPTTRSPGPSATAPSPSGPRGAPTPTTRRGAAPASPPSSTPSAVPSVAVPASDAVGPWNVSPGSQVGYRIEERMLGGGFAGTRTAVGRTPAVSGSLVVRRDAQGLAATVTVDADLKQLASDSPRRDQVLRTAGLVTDRFPGATFYADTRVPAGADTGRDFALETTGKLTLKGVTRDVNVRMTGRMELGRILLVGQVTLTLADFGISPPDVAGVVDVADRGQVEFSLVFVKGA